MATFGRILAPLRAAEVLDAGAYKIEGQTLRGGSAYRSRVLLFPMNSMFPIREAWSAVDGSWSFENLALAEYLVLAIDKSGERNAVTYSFVESVPM